MHIFRVKLVATFCLDAQASYGITFDYSGCNLLLLRLASLSPTSPRDTSLSFVERPNR